jgi:hypothetical protein
VDGSRLKRLHELAKLLGVPARWLAEEADASRIPCLRVGRRRLFDPAAVEHRLLERASGVKERPGSYTPREVARLRGISPAKVYALINQGVLEAVNHASKAQLRPQWRISAEALARFDHARSNRKPPTPVRPRKRCDPNVIEFFR